MTTKRPEKQAFVFTMDVSTPDRCDTVCIKSLPAAQEKILNVLFRDLIHECKHSAPSARLSKKLRKGLERVPPPIRCALVSKQVDGCAPLFISARRGNVEVLEYLIDVCIAPIEQTGVYEVTDSQSVHIVPPLWVAGVNGHVAVVKALLDRGANVNTVSDTGSTTIRSACFMSHYNVIQLLITFGADVNRPNYNRSTCLINCVQCSALTTFLIENGADVNATDLEGKTALHYAALEDSPQTARLLLRNGADPRIRSVWGDDVIRTAAIKGSIDTVTLLVSDVVEEYSRAELADTYEVLGATLLEQEGVMAAMEAWRTATALRGGSIPKVLPAARAGVPEEWATEEQLQWVGHDQDDMWDQALAVLYRVLGEQHPVLTEWLMNRGSVYVAHQITDRSLNLWTWALQLRVEQLTLLDPETVISLCAWTRLALECWWGGEPTLTPATLRGVAELLHPALAQGSHLLTLRPHSISQQEMFDCALRCVTHLIYLLIETAVTTRDKYQVDLIISDLVSLDLRAGTGDTLLHLSVSRLNHISSTLMVEEAYSPPIFPCVDVVRALCENGASPDCTNYSGSTPIHVAAIYTNYNQDILNCLLYFGAHLDRPSRFGDSAYSLIWARPALRHVCLKHVSLSCLSAVAVPNKREVLKFMPKPLREVIEMHMA